MCLIFNALKNYVIYEVIYINRNSEIIIESDRHIIGSRAESLDSILRTDLKKEYVTRKGILPGFNVLLYRHEIYDGIHNEIIGVQLLEDYNEGFLVLDEGYNRIATYGKKTETRTIFDDYIQIDNHMKFIESLQFKGVQIYFSRYKARKEKDQSNNKQGPRLIFNKILKHYVSLRRNENEELVVVDFGKLESVDVKDYYPIPKIVTPSKEPIQDFVKNSYPMVWEWNILK